ncbi:MAG: SDR family oxidoreductase [Alphaproteobacteria bacterium]|nr:SDR family oxidoreductase [Alphaproteobacteria bacterium]
MTDDTLAGKTILITGAASGIGRALAVAFAAEGADVVAADLNAEALGALASSGCRTITVDVSNSEAVKRAVGAAVEGRGRVDVFFNNAGIGGRRAIEDLADGEFERMVQVHLFGGLYCLRAVLPVMRLQGHGRIINTLSRGAEAQAAGWAAYGAAKAGLFALTRVAAAETAGSDILVNGMIPGPTQSGMNKGPDLQPPEAVVPGARWLATLPAGGPSGKVFWDRREYRLFEQPPMQEGPGERP